jgi:imidazolonepropionase-like amidohydrolase
MKRIAGLALLAGLVSLAAPAEEPPLLAVRAARLLDVRSGRIVENPVIVIRGDRIESVQASIPAGVKGGQVVRSAGR